MGAVLVAVTVWRRDIGRWPWLPTMAVAGSVLVGPLGEQLRVGLDGGVSEVKSCGGSTGCAR